MCIYNKSDGSGPNDIKTKYYAGNLYEKEITESDTREINYIFANGNVVAVYEKSDMEGEKTLYMHHDHLGSVIAYSDESGKLVEELSYDAWGRRRNPDTWEYYDLSSSDIAIYDSGFTGHEHIDMFDMINMDVCTTSSWAAYFVSAKYLYDYLRNNYSQYMHKFNGTDELRSQMSYGIYYQNGNWSSSSLTGHIDAMYNGKWAGHMYKKPINVGFY